MNNPALSIVIPAYNEGKRIGRTLESIARYFKDHPSEYEVIVVDDGSADDTAEVARTFEGRLNDLKVLTNAQNRGKGYAVRCGMRAARGEYRLFMDADNSVDIVHIEEFARWIDRGYDVVIGSITVPGARVIEHSGKHRRLLGNLSHSLISLVATPGIRDTQRGFKLFTARAAKALFTLQTIERFGFDIELLVIAQKQGFRVREVPVAWDNPSGSTVTLRSYGKTILELVRIQRNRLLRMYRLRTLSSVSARRLINRAELSILLLLATGVGTLFLYNWHLTLVFLVAVLAFLYTLDLLFNLVVIFRSMARVAEIQISPEEIAARAEWPRYNVLCPLYREAAVLPQFVAAMQQLDYPTEKLEVLLILEEDDRETIAAVEDIHLPSHFTIVLVPHSIPKTKPKACNYALSRITGEYAVIYDAEDIPAPDQLKKAVVAFDKCGDKTVCLQAKLNFYNPHQNVLTRLFTLEYSLWFEVILTGLQTLDGPIPLGGTSNHFKALYLHELQGWDPFNVTEDADLGMRIFKRGYETAIIDSTTMEEANSRFKNWFRQRSRWIKGYMQTYLVHMQQPLEFDTGDLLLFQFIVGGKVLTSLINPLMWVLTILYFAARSHFGAFIDSLYIGPALYIGGCTLIFGNFLYMYMYMVGVAERRQWELVKYTALVPVYWLMISAAAYYALWELIVRPFHWHKTEHGLHLPSNSEIAAV